MCTLTEYALSRRLLRSVWLLLIVAVAAPVYADTLAAGLRTWVVGEDAEPLPPDQAFRVSARAIAGSAVGSAAVQLYWDIADGYYLYRDVFRLQLAAPVRPGDYVLPAGVRKEDPEFGAVEVYYDSLSLRVPLEQVPPPPFTARLTVEYQGCKEGSVCYPVISRTLPVELEAGGSYPVVAAGVGAVANPALLKPGDPAPLRLLQTGSIQVVLGGFFVLGLLLAFTPCVLPMLPILSALLAGTRGPRRAFLLTLIYVLTIACTYAVLGLVAGQVGVNLQTAAQSPWLLVPFSLVLVLLAAAMFGVYELQWPAAWQEWLVIRTASRSGGYTGALLMGAASAVLAGPCVAPPVLAAMLYISRTGDGVYGALSLFSMGLGFGVPLLLFGTALGWCLPRTGPWMVQVRRLLGVLILALAIVFAGRVLPAALVLLAWGALALGCALYLGALRPYPATASASFAGLPGRVTGLVLLVYGVVLVLGAAMGGTDPLRPLQRQSPGTAGAVTMLQFRTVYTLEELHTQLAQAAQADHPILVDVYADWCVECKRLERTFNAPEVRSTLAGVVLVRVDVTRDTPAARTLLSSLELYGPPAVLFFGGDQRERRVWRLYEYAAPVAFARRVRQAFAS